MYPVSRRGRFGSSNSAQGYRPKTLARVIAGEKALRCIKPEVRPEHYAAFYASAVEGQDTETVMRLYNLSRDNLYQIRKRLTAKLRETVPVVLSEMESPDCR